MIKRQIYPFLCLCLSYLCSSTATAQTSKSFAILEPEPVISPTILPFALGGLEFITLSDGTSAFITLFYNQIALVHASKSSNAPWAKIMSFENRELSPKIAPTPDGGFLANMIITRAASETINKFVLAKFNAQNVLQWVKTIQFDENTTTSVQNLDFAVGSDGNILLTGTIKEQNAATEKFFYLFLNARGERVRSFYVNEFLANVSVCGRSGGGFASISFTGPTPNGQHRLMIFDAQGQLLSSKIYQGDPSFYGFSILLEQKPSGGFVGTANAGIVDFDDMGNYVKSVFPIFGSVSFGSLVNQGEYIGRDGRIIRPGAALGIGSSFVTSAFYVYDSTITMHYLQDQVNQAFNVKADDGGGIVLSTSSIRSSLAPVNPPLKVFQYAINPAFDRTDCGIQILKQTIPSTSSALVRLNLPDLVLTNLNPIILTVTNNSLQLTNFNVSHSLLCPSVSVSEANLASNISITPNPSNDVFSIKSDNQNADLQRLTVYNNLGQIVLDRKESSWETPLRVERSGTYFIKIQTNRGSVLKKIVKVD